MSQVPNSFWPPSNNPGSPVITQPPPTTQERGYTVTSPLSSQQHSHPTLHPTPQDHVAGSAFRQPPPPSFGPHMSLAPTIYQRPPSKWDVISSSSSPSPYPYGPRPWILPEVNAYSSTNFPNTHERLGTYRSLTSALTGTRTLQSIENKIDRIEANVYQKDAKAAAVATVVDKGQGLSQTALESMMQNRLDSFLGQMAESVGQMVRQEVGQHLDRVHTAVDKGFGAVQEAMMRDVHEAREQDVADTRHEVKEQLQGLLESIKAERYIRQQGTEEHLAKLLSDQAAAIRDLEQKQDMQADLQEQRDRKQTQNVVGSVQELREAVEKLVTGLHMRETNELAYQREMRRMISELQQGLVAVDLTRRLDKDEESKRHLDAEENFSAIETRVAELAEDFSELAETLKDRHGSLARDIEGLKRQQDQILTSLQENHRQQQQYLESRFLSPAVSEVASGTTLVNAPQTAKAPTGSSSNNSDNGQNFKHKRIKIEPGTAPQPTERTMMTRMMSKVLGGIVT
ncbi:hypothetical protein BGZ93_009610 [Podila epicladia]|nr:hypothetical protein BGZ93_009610 [Podila epicladia]